MNDSQIWLPCIKLLSGMKEEKANEQNVVFLENGDIMFQGKLISSAEYLVCNVLCQMKTILDDAVHSKEAGTDKSSRVLINGTEDSLSDSSEESPNQQGTAIQIVGEVATKRRKKIVHALPPGDCRLTYVKKYLDAINSGDAMTVLAMFNEIAIPRMVTVIRKSDPNYHMPRNIEIVGTHACALAAEQYSLSVPDVVFQPVSETVKLFANGESSIEVVINVKGNQMYTMNGFAGREKEKMVLSSPSAVTTSDVAASVNDLSDQLSRVVIATAVDEEGRSRKESVPFAAGEALQQGIRDISGVSHLTLYLNTNKKLFLVVST